MLKTMGSLLKLSQLFSRCVISPALSKNLSTLQATSLKPGVLSRAPFQNHVISRPTQLLNVKMAGNMSQHRYFEYFSFTKTLPRYINRIIKEGPPKRKKRKLGPTEGRPFLKGVVLKTLIKKPKKPNSANRKCVRVRLSTGRELTAYIPGIGHNLQEHHTVLVRGGKMQDLPGVKVKCVRGKYDLAHVKKTT